MIIGINCGHTVAGSVGSGAVGFLNESDETRAVGNILIDKLRERGHTVINCTNDRAASVTENLAIICEIANAQFLDAFISIHFNSGGGTGCEAYTYNGENKAFAGEMTSALSDLGFRDRGIKDGSYLYVIRNTNAPACLLEVCFVDSSADTDRYRELKPERIAEALCDAIDGKREGGLTVTEYEELSRKIDELSEKLTPFIYNYIDDNMPEWARETVQKLVDKGFLNGDENGLNLTEEMLRLLVINDRAGLYD